MAACPKCHVRMMCEAGPTGGVPGNELNCCKCIPRRLQVNVTDGGGYRIICKAFAVDCTTGHWTGVVTIDDVAIDLAFYFGRSDGDDCRFYLESVALDLELASSDTRLSEPMPGDWSSYRTARAASCENPEFTFTDVDLEAAIPGYGLVNISTQIADYQTINPAHLKRCDPIDPDYCPDAVTCLDCNCFCRCVCITFQDADETFTERVCLDDYTETWSITTAALDTLTISIGCDDVTGESQLVLTDPYNSTTRAIAANCPEIAGAWAFTKPDTSPVSVGISCDTCGECLGGDPAACGCYDPINALLYATFSAGASPGPPEPYPKSCTDATGVIPILWDTPASAWLGFGTPFGCSTVVYLRMTCASSGMMKLELGDSWATLGDMGTVAVTCDPFTGEWIGLTPLLATDACCGTAGDPGTADYNIFNVTVTE